MFAKLQKFEYFRSDSEERLLNFDRNVPTNDLK